MSGMLTAVPGGRVARAFSVVAAVLGAAACAAAQEVNIVVPQAVRSVVRPERLPAPAVKLTAVSVSVEITGQVAATTMELVLTNTTGAQQEARLLVPVPDGVAVRSFGIDSISGEPTARIVPREEARRIYDSIVSKMRDPGLLEFAGHTHISTSVFPIPAHGTNTARLTYEGVLSAEAPATGTRVDYVLPRSDALAADGAAWSVSLDVRADRPIATVYSPSHDITTDRRAPERVAVKLAGEAAKQPGAFRLSYVLDGRHDGPAVAFLAYPDPEVSGGDGGYFLMVAATGMRPPVGARPLGREVTIVLDRSGSMRGEKMEQAREAARQVLEGLDDRDWFNIIDYSDSIASFSDRPVRKTEESMRAARAYLEGIRATGGTNIHDALLEALRQEPAENTLPVVLFLTDGLPTVGRTGERAIREGAEAANKHERRVFTFGVGHDVNAPLLSALAKGSRAASTFVAPEEDVEVKVGQVFRRLAGPVLSSPELTAVHRKGGVRTSAVRELQPGKLPDLFEGDQLVVLGQYTSAEPIRFELKGDYLGQERVFEFKLDPAEASARHGYVPRLWAGRKIAALTDEIRQAAADGGSMPEAQKKELVDEIVRLSMKYGILTEYTSFLATEPGMGGEAPPPVGAARARASEAVGQGGRVRAGKEAVAAQTAVDAAYEQKNLGAQNVYRDADGREVRRAGVRQVADRALFRRGERWVDGLLLAQEKEPPQQTVAFGTPEYAALLDQLLKEGRQGLLAVEGEVYLLVGGERVLVRNP